MALCPSVCLSVTRRHCIETAVLAFGVEATVGLFILRLILHCVGTWVSPKIRTLFFKTLPQTLDFIISQLHGNRRIGGRSV